MVSNPTVALLLAAIHKQGYQSATLLHEAQDSNSYSGCAANIEDIENLRLVTLNERNLVINRERHLFRPVHGSAFFLLLVLLHPLRHALFRSQVSSPEFQKKVRARKIVLLEETWTERLHNAYRIGSFNSVQAHVTCQLLLASR